MSFPELLWVFLKAALLTSGGLQSLPILLDELTVQRHLLTDGDFATAVAIGRISPGPNGLFVLSIGYYVSGLAGALAAAIGIMLPPFLAIGLVRAHRRLANRSWVLGMTRGITAAGVGLLTGLGYTFGTPLVAEPASFGIFVVAMAVLLLIKADALPVLLAGGAAAVVLHFLGVPLV